MKAPKIVQAPEGCNDYLTVGKNYRVIGLWDIDHTYDSGFCFTIKTDEGNTAKCLERNCAHLKRGSWIIIERES